MRKWLFCFALILICAQIALAEPVAITKITSSRTRGFDYLDIHTTGNAKGKGLLLEDQLIINYPNTKIAEDIKISLEKSKRIENVTVKQVDDKTARVVVALKKSIDYEVVNVFGRNKSVVEISNQLDYTARLMAAWEKAKLKMKGDTLNPFKYDPILTNKDNSLKGKTIVLEPGHGGRDPGAFSLNKTPEKRLTLKTARKIEKLLILKRFFLR